MAVLGAHHILHVSRIRVKEKFYFRRFKSEFVSSESKTEENSALAFVLEKTTENHELRLFFVDMLLQEERSGLIRNKSYEIDSLAYLSAHPSVHKQKFQNL